jgi:hypothetical protein
MQTPAWWSRFRADSRGNRRGHAVGAWHDPWVRASRASCPARPRDAGEAELAARELEKLVELASRFRYA